MASPFFIGPKEGDYPGTPIAGGGGRFGGIFNEFKPDPRMEFSKLGLFGNLYEEVSGTPGSLWRGFVNEFKGDIDGALTVPGGYKSKMRGALTVEVQQDQYEANQLPGAMDPQIKLKDVFSPNAYWEVIKKGINAEDIERRARGKFVGGLVTGSAPDSIGSTAAKKAFAQYVTAASGQSTNDPIQLLKLTDRQVFKKKEDKVVSSIDAATGAVVEGGKKLVDVDVYKELGDSVVDFTLHADSPPLRITKFNNFNSKASEALGTSLTHLYDGQNQLSASAIWQTVTTHLSANDRKNAEIGVEAFLHQKKVADGMGSIGTTLGTTQLTKQLGAYYTTGDAGLIGQIQGNFTNLQTTITDAQNNISIARNFLENNDQLKLKKFNDAVKNYEKTLRRLELDLANNLAPDGELARFLADASTAGSKNVILRKKAARFATKYQELGKKISGADYLQQGSQRHFLHTILHDDLIRPTSTTSLGVILPALNDEAMNAISPWVYRMHEDYERQSMTDFINNHGKGKLTSTYGYTRIKGRFRHYTVSNVIEETLSRVHYFGLKIDEDYLTKPGKEKFLLFRPFNWIVDKPMKKLGLTVHGIKMNIPELGFVRTKGGKHFTSGVVFAKKFFSQEADIGKIASIMGAADLNAFKTLAVGLSIDGWGKNAQEAFDSVQELKAWLLKDGRKLGIMDAAGNIDNAKLEKFLTWVQRYSTGTKGIDNIPLTRAYAGVIEKLSQALNTSQSFILRNARNVIVPIFNAKTIIAEKIAYWASLAAGKLFTYFTGGTGVIFEKAIRWITRIVIIKTVDFFRAIKYGDINKFLALNETLIIGTLKVIAYIMVIPAFMILMGTEAVSTVLDVTPKDNPTKVTNFYASQGSGGGDLVPLPDGDQSGACLGQVEEDLRCVQVGGRFTQPDAGSYTPGYGGRGHGTNTYWSYVPGNDCNFAIPYLPDFGRGGMCPGSTDAACSPSTDPASICKGAPSRPYYGYAMDIAGGSGIYLPTIDGVTSWSIGSGVRNNFDGGNMISAEADVDADDNGTIEARYKILYLHLGPICVNPGVYTAGQRIANGFQGKFGNHTHIELSISYDGSTWEPVKPEDHITGCGR